MRRILIIGAVLLASLSPVKAADSTVTALSAASALGGTELLYCVQGGADRKCTPAQQTTYTNSLFSQDCTVTSGGVVTCLKTNNVAFGALATTVPGTGVATAAAANLSAAGGITSTIASGTSALGTSAIGSAACATAVTTTATNTATTDVVLWGFNGDPTAVTGYVPLVAGMLTIIAYPSANNVNFKICNNTSSSVTPGAITLNWRVVR